MRYLVTGGAGFIGSHCVDYLLAKGNEVSVIDNLDTGNMKNLESAQKNKKFKFFQEDIMDMKALSKAGKGCETIIHEAAVVGVKAYVKDPLKVLMVNTKGTENVLELARKNDAKVVFASTSETYGKEKVPLREDSNRVLGPTWIDRWCYSTSKAFDEHLLFAYHKKYGLKMAILRYFNIYGERARGTDYGGVIPIFIRRVLNNESPQVHGTGEQTRCFAYISDCIEGTMIALEKLNGDVVNIGSDKEITINALAEKVIEISGMKGKITPEKIPYEEFYGKSYEDIQRRVPSIEKIKSLGWDNKISLEEGLKRTIEWWRKEQVQQ